MTVVDQRTYVPPSTAMTMGAVAVPPGHVGQQPTRQHSGHWVLYRPAAGLPDLQPYVNKEIDVIVRQSDSSPVAEPRLHRQLWGTDIYTDDSDVVAALYHSGKMAAYRADTSGDFVITVKVLQKIVNFEGCLRWSIQSRTWHNHDGYSFSVVEVRTFSRLKPSQRHRAQAIVTGPRVALSGLWATLKPTPGVIGMGTVGSSGDALAEHSHRKKIVFGLAQEATFKYDLGNVVDVGLEDERRTSYKLKSQILYLEGTSRRFALFTTGDQDAEGYDRFAFHEDLEPRTPPPAVGALPESRRKVLHDSIDWADVEWGADGVEVQGTMYPLHAMFWHPAVAEPPSPDTAVASCADTAMACTHADDADPA